MAGRSFLDVICGGVNVSLMAAELVGMNGHVAAVDFDEKIILLAILDAQYAGTRLTYNSMHISIESA